VLSPRDGRFINGGIDDSTDARRRNDRRGKGSGLERSGYLTNPVPGRLPGRISWAWPTLPLPARFYVPTHARVAGAERIKRGLVFFQQGTWQLEVLTLVRPRIEEFRAAGTDAFHLSGIVFGEAGPCIEFAGMRKHVAAASLVDVKADHLPADGALRH
jgi:hypothetical protein